MKAISFFITALVAAKLANAAAAEPQLATVVTVAKRAQLLAATNASATVITRAEIERTQASDAVVLLRRVAGVDISRTGGPGSATSIFLRGTNSNHTLVLIDGVRVASANTGSYALEQLPIEMIERIEIVRGPRAALWGSDAIGGVIQIFTQAPKKLSAQIAVGSFDAFRSQVSYGVSDDQLQAGVSLSRGGSGGFSAQNANGFDYNPDNDAHYVSRAAVHVESSANENLVLSASAVRSDTDVEFDQGRSDLSDRTVALSAVQRFSAGHSHSFRFGYAAQSLDTPVYFSRFRSNRIQGDYQHDFPLAHGADISVGINLQRETGTGAGENNLRDQRSNVGTFLRGAKDLGKHNLEASVRIDDYTGFGMHPSASAAWGYALAADARVYFSVGQGFRAPNFNELYSPGFDGQFAGNPALNPERSNSMEVGFRTATGGSSDIGVNVFRTRVAELINFSGVNFRATNIAQAAIDGAELTLAWRAERCSVSGNLSVQNPRDSATGQQLLRRAKRKAYLGAQCSIGALELSADGFVSGRRKDFGATLPGYGLLDMGVRYSLSDHYALSLKFENVGDTQYELAHGFNTPGRNVMLSLNFVQ
jgi:vitamin B12 transporter